MTEVIPECDCADCRVAHDDDPDHTYYTAHEVADAWQDGHTKGEIAAVRKLHRVITDWLKTAPDDPTLWLTEDDPA